MMNKRLMKSSTSHQRRRGTIPTSHQKQRYPFTDQIIDFNEDDYGYGPMVFLEGYMAILGAGNEDDYVEHLVRAIQGKELNEASEIETYYYLKDGKVQNS